LGEEKWIVVRKSTSEGGFARTSTDRSAGGKQKAISCQQKAISKERQPKGKKHLTVAVIRRAWSIDTTVGREEK
jgi:hypothetical protein